jgi:hypothetical protein
LRAEVVDPDNEQIVVGIALNVLAGKGWIEEEPSEELVDALRRLYRETPRCQVAIEFTGEILHDLLAARPGEELAAAWEGEQQDEWERHHAPRWQCPCGEAYGLYEFWANRVAFYTLTDDGLFWEPVSECGSCGRDLAETRAKVGEGQLGFAF